MFYYIQRLLDPKPELASQFNAKKSTFQNKGLPVVQEIFRADYMGDANFEFGSLRNGLKQFFELAAQKELRAKTIQIEAKHSHTEVIETCVSDNRTKTIILSEDFSAIKDVYIIAPRDLTDNLGTFLSLHAQNSKAAQTAQFTSFSPALFSEEIRAMSDPKREIFDDRFKGWFDLGSASFFFRDREMYQKLALASGIAPDV